MKLARLLCAVVLLSFLEVGLTIGLTRWLGAWLTYSIFAVPTLAGVAVQIWRWPAMKEAMSRVAADAGSQRRPRGRHRPKPPNPLSDADTMEIMCYWLAMVLFLIPGPLTAVVAFLLVLPSTRRGAVGGLARVLFGGHSCRGAT